jgi:excisionase family DNA binding protein
MPSRVPSTSSSPSASPKPERAAPKPSASGERVEPWASIDEAAAHLGVRKDSVYRWIESRGLPAKKIGKLWKLKLSEVDAWVSETGAGTGADDAPVAAPRGKPTRAKAARDHVVLVIDDEAMVRETVGDFLTDEGYRVLLATSGAHGLKLLATASIKPSVILLDLKMPDVDGWQFRELQMRDAALATIPVIVLTGTPNATVEGASLVLRKPLRLPVIGKAIRTVIESAQELSDGER